MTRLAAHQAAAERWIADDVDVGDQTELQRILTDALTGDLAATEELAVRMAGPLRFGTAGLRGPLRAGPAGMNRAVVLRASAGLARWLIDQGRSGIVVVGRDARHRSEQFAADAAGVFGAAGFDAVLLPRPLPTPVLAFAARTLGAVAGVQITASHNPAGDNGYKVYLEGGTPIAPPTDAAIEAAIAAAPPAVAVPQDGLTRVGDVLEGYLQRVASLPRGTARALRVVATPLHGVGGSVLIEALRRAGFTDVHLVAKQAEPDPTFPTVRFPNPEEPGATDALLALAAELDADLAIALDPDADRCALGTRDREGTWRMLCGDETGVLLGEYLLTNQHQPEPLVATSLVSSSLLGRIAAAHGARYAQTRTGFKWLMRAGSGPMAGSVGGSPMAGSVDSGPMAGSAGGGLNAGSAGGGLVYAYEEALGYCVDPEAVRDKDGIGAAVLACDLAATALAGGHTLDDLLDGLAVRHGVHRTDQVSLRLADHPAVATAMAGLRAQLPTELDGHPVRVEDLAHHPHQPDNTLALHGRGFRVMVRPSGTEPKLKAYLEVIEPVPTPARLAAAQQAATQRLTALRTATLACLRTSPSEGGRGDR